MFGFFFPPAGVGQKGDWLSRMKPVTVIIQVAAVVVVLLLSYYYVGRPLYFDSLIRAQDAASQASPGRSDVFSLSASSPLFFDCHFRWLIRSLEYFFFVLAHLTPRAWESEPFLEISLPFAAILLTVVVVKHA